MTETLEEAVARLTKKYHPQGGAVTERERPWIEDDARAVLRVQVLPVIKPDANGMYHCPATTVKGSPCSRFLQLNYSTTDDEGFASLNCTYHGWVGKWRE